jgi:hypothetical protein
VTLEMISGPDLGGGFLFQLTVDRAGALPRLTYHAQEGGIDASGPPKGSPRPFGFRRSSSPCSIGGRDCYHRDFDLEESSVPRARLAYNRFRFVLAPMMDQQYGTASVPATAALTEVAGRIAALPAGQRPQWFVGGSGAALVQGVAASPHDLDLGCDRTGVDRIAEALQDYLIEPPAWTEWHPGRRVYAARAFVGTLRDGVRVEWAATDNVDGPAEPWTEWGRPPAEVRLGPAGALGPSAPSSRLEYFVVKRAVRGDWAAVDAAAPVLRSQGVDGTLLDQLIAASPLSATAAARVRRGLEPTG